MKVPLGSVFKNRDKCHLRTFHQHQSSDFPIYTAVSIVSVSLLCVSTATGEMSQWASLLDCRAITTSAGV